MNVFNISMCIFILSIIICIFIIFLNKEKYEYIHNYLKDIKNKSKITYDKKYGIIVSNKKLSKNRYKDRIGIVIPTFGRPEFLKQMLNNLSKAKLDNTVIVIADETATKHENNISNEMKRIILDYEIKNKVGNIPIIKIFKKRHGNMYDSFKIGFDLLEELGCNMFMTLDSDAIVKKNFIQKLMEIYQLHKHRLVIISGFHTTNNNHKVIKEYPTYRTKSSIGGINMLFNKNTYKNYFRPTLTDEKWDWVVGDKIKEKKGLLIVTKPSVVDHIGSNGLWSTESNYDKSDDF